MKTASFFECKKMEVKEMEKEKELIEQEDALTEEEGMNAADFMDVKLSKPYKFEGKEITELDLNKLEDLTGADMIAINRMMKKRGNTDASPELTMEFAFFAAMQATGLPLEFFYALSMKDSMKVKTRVNYFLVY